MILLPAIDLYDNKVVRLINGDYDQMTIYSNNAVNQAKEIEASGASWLHVVDLDGAKNGTTPAYHTIADIISSTSLKVEVGGGIRDLATIDKYISAGVDRVIIGTKAIEDRNFLEKAIDKFSENLAVGCDAYNGHLATHGWMQDSGIEISGFIRKLTKMGVKTVIATDISRDGAMRGTNIELYRMLDYLGNINIIASGGVSSYEDLDALNKIGVYGAIVGKAMYEGSIDISTAIKRIGANNDK